jgi:hypothetical protein
MNKIICHYCGLDPNGPRMLPCQNDAQYFFIRKSDAPQWLSLFNALCIEHDVNRPYANMFQSLTLDEYIVYQIMDS